MFQVFQVATYYLRLKVGDGWNLPNYLLDVPIVGQVHCQLQRIHYI